MGVPTSVCVLICKIGRYGGTVGEAVDAGDGALSAGLAPSMPRIGDN